MWENKTVHVLVRFSLAGICRYKYKLPCSKTELAVVLVLFEH